MEHSFEIGDGSLTFAYTKIRSAAPQIKEKMTYGHKKKMWCSVFHNAISGKCKSFNINFRKMEQMITEELFQLSPHRLDFSMTRLLQISLK